VNIDALAHELKLSYLKEHHDMIITEAEHKSPTYKEFLTNYLETEREHRRINGIKRKMRNAKFPYQKHISHFELDKYKYDLQAKMKKLMDLSFINNKENIIMIGNPGSGKTHLSIALGVKAVEQGMNVLFISVPDLMIQIKEALSNRQLDLYKKKFEKYDLVILDELGYVSFDKSGCEILFNLLSNRNNKGSIIITSNLNFDRWEEIFKDPMLTGAMIDRLAHKAHIMDMTVETSYRYEETKQWMKEQNS
jgi:DNA replication protein DnaC